MRTILKLSALFISILLIASCEKKVVSEQAQSSENTVDVSGFILPQINTSVEEYPLEFSSADKKQKRLIQIQKIGLEKRDKVTKVRHRPSSSSSSSCGKANEISCGTYFTQGSTEEDVVLTNDDSKNINGENFYSRVGFNTSFEGNEKSYYLTIEEETLVKFSLLGLSNQVAVLLLEANLSCDKVNGVDITTEQYTKLVAYDNAFPNRTNQFGPVRLQPGQYALVIDSQPNKGSDFLLNVQCQAPNSATTCGANSLFYESFALYDSNEDISNQSSYWEKWSPESQYDGLVACCDANFGKILGIVRRPTDNENQPNVLFTVGERNSGYNELEFYFGMPRGYSGYFSIQKFLTERNANNEEGAKFFFRETGKGSIEVGERTIDFNYPNGLWMKLRFEFDFDNDKTSFYIGNDLIGQWKASDTHLGTDGITQIEALNFYPFYSNSLFFAERFCFSE